jgi:hypothetical protein
MEDDLDSWHWSEWLDCPRMERKRTACFQWTYLNLKAHLNSPMCRKHFCDIRVNKLRSNICIWKHAFCILSNVSCLVKDASCNIHSDPPLPSEQPEFFGAFYKVLETFPGMLFHADVLASCSCCRLDGGTFMLQTACSISSQICSIGFRSGDCSGHSSKLNLLSCYMRQV